jgi:pyroglutamyl-peptidase
VRFAYAIAMPQIPAARLKSSWHRPVVLLTGFGPFPGITENVSARLVNEIACRARDEFSGHDFHTSVLPVDWRTAPKHVTDLLLELQPVVALHFGVDKEAKGFRLESQGRNICQPAEDAVGAAPLAPVLVAGAADAYPSRLPVAVIAARLEALVLPVSISHDAGGYLCNAVLYHALHSAEAGLHFGRAGFVHVPHNLSGPPLTFDEALCGGVEIIRISLEDASG